MVRLFEAKTIQGSIIKTVAEIVKDLITDGNWVLSPEGIALTATDPTQTILIKMRLDATKFQVFSCPNRMIIGLNMLNLFKLLRTISSNDTLTLFIDELDPSKLGIQIDNDIKNSVTTFKANLIDLDQHEVQENTSDQFETMITMPSNDFQKYVRDMSNLNSDVLEICCIGTQLILSCKSDFASQETVIGQNGTNCVDVQATDDKKIIQGIFSLKYLTTFSKCQSISPLVQIWLKSDYPLILKYDIADLGALSLMVAPRTA